MQGDGQKFHRIGAVCIVCQRRRLTISKGCKATAHKALQFVRPGGRLPERRAVVLVVQHGNRRKRRRVFEQEQRVAAHIVQFVEDGQGKAVVVVILVFVVAGHPVKFAEGAKQQN